jgi:hypothetical protein
VGTGDQVTIPAAIQELVIRYFGEAAIPSYARTPGLLARDPYRPVRAELARSWTFSDLTSADLDLGFVWAFEGHPDLPTVRLSLGGPYALVTNPKGEVIRPPDIVEILERQGFVLLDRELLERPFTFWEPEYEAPLYEFIFEFDEGFPWAR